MSESWSEKHIQDGTSYTSRSQFDELLQILDERRRRFYPINKSGSHLEVYGDNPRVVVNELPTHSASIWYGLYDGTLLRTLNETERDQITAILQKYFGTSTIPVIPILRTDPGKEPKYKFKNKQTRVYSMYGGANIRTFLGIGMTDPYRTDSFHSVFTELTQQLNQQGFQIEDQLPNGDELLSNCQQYLQIVEEIKDKLGAYGDDAQEHKKIVIALEFCTKMHVTLQILRVLGINHGHPHGGNWVTTWSKETLTQQELEEELINPRHINADYDEMEKAYPHCQIHPLLIDFDMTSFMSHKTGNYDMQKLVQLLDDPNCMHQVIALQLLPFNQWPPDFLLSIFDKNSHLAGQVIRKLKLHFFADDPSMTLTPETLQQFFQPILEAGISLDNTLFRDLLLATLPGLAPGSENKISWKNWITYFQANPNQAALKSRFLELVLGQAVSVKGKDELLRVVENLISDNVQHSKRVRQLIRGHFLKKKPHSNRHLRLKCIMSIGALKLKL